MKKFCLQGPMHRSRNFHQGAQAHLTEKKLFLLLFLVLNYFYNFTVGVQLFFLRKTIIFQGSRGAPMFSMWCPTFLRGIQFFPGGGGGTEEKPIELVIFQRGWGGGSGHLSPLWIHTWNLCSSGPHHVKISLQSLQHINSYKPSILFVGHRQTGQAQIRHRIKQCLIRVFTVCLQNVLLKFGKKEKIPPNTPAIGNGLVLLIRVAGDKNIKYCTCSAGRVTYNFH